jgi:fibronectin type 3 domain-containing protein
VIPANDGADVGVVTVTTGVNFKTSLSPTQSSVDMSELYINETYSFNLEFENVGDEDCRSPSYTITAPDRVSVTGTLQGILGTIEPSVRKSVPIRVTCFEVEGDYEYKKINVTIRDASGKTWEDSVSLRFYKETINFNIKAQQPISGVVISPDAKTYSFTTITDGTVAAPLRKSGDYLVVFSGATIETETRYALGIGAEADGTFSSLSDSSVYEPNNTEGTTVAISEQRIMAYLYKNDIDYYRVSYSGVPFPAMPTNVSARVADAEVSVSWDAVSGAVSYNVYRSDNQEGAYAKVGTSAEPSYTDTAAAVGTYWYKIIAVSADGLESPYSASTEATVIAPAAPTNVSTSVTDAEVSVSWDAASDAVSYNVYRSDNQAGTYAKVGTSTEPSYTDTVAAVGTYWYTIIAVSAGGFESAYSEPTSATATGPSAPTNGSASVMDAKVTVSWSAVLGADSYNVYRSGSQAGTYAKVGTSAEPSYTETVAAVGTYWYTISAVSADGFESAHSEPTSATVIAPATPANVSASVTDADAEVSVSWDAVSGAGSYNVYRSISQEGTYINVGTSAAASYTDTVAAVGTYYYKVSAVSARGFESAYSEPTSATATGPSAPANVSAGVTDANVTVSWDAVSGAHSYNVYRSGSQAGTYAKIGESASLSYIDTVDDVGTYYYRISAISADGLEGVYSTPASATVTIEIGVAALTDTLSEVAANAVDFTYYTLLLGRDETIPAQTLSYSGKTVMIILKGSGGERTVNLSGNGSLFTVGDGVTLVVDEGVTLKGHGGNNASLVSVNSGGTLLLKDGAKISGNTASAAYYGGGGVSVSGRFEMSGGIISGNTASSYYYGGGGVYVSSSGAFEMSGGTISGNTVSSYYSSYPYSFGGGVYVSGTFTMSDGTISGNTASTGGGAYVNGTFTKQSGGTIYGSDASDSLKNTARIYGHAIYVSTSPAKERNTTAGVGVTLDSGVSGSAGGWEG